MHLQRISSKQTASLTEVESDEVESMLWVKLGHLPCNIKALKKCRWMKFDINHYTGCLKPGLTSIVELDLPPTTPFLGS